MLCGRVQELSAAPSQEQKEAGEAKTHRSLATAGEIFVAVPFLTPLFWEGSPTKIEHRKGYPYSNLSAGGPSCGFDLAVVVKTVLGSHF